MLTIQDAMLPEAANCDAAALVFTSANGVDAFIRQSGQFGSKAIYAVGPQTAERLVAQGARSLLAGAGDAASLLKLIHSTWRPTDGKIVHISGKHVSSDIATELAQCGYQSSRLVAYSAVPATSISCSTLEELRSNAFDGVVFLSRRTAQIFLLSSGVSRWRRDKGNHRILPLKSDRRCTRAGYLRATEMGTISYAERAAPDFDGARPELRERFSFST